MSGKRTTPLSAAEIMHVEAWGRDPLPVEGRTCEICKSRWGQSPMHHRRCPSCSPQPTPIIELLSDSSYWPGHRFAWSVDRGPGGRWVTAERMWAPIKRIFDTVRDLLPDADGEAGFAANLRSEMLRLRAIANDAAEPVRRRVECEQQRANRLADECGKLQRALETKRIQCDVLRDENDRLRRASP